MSVKTVCTQCGWNNGLKVTKNRFGCRESVRVCGYFGLLPIWQPIKKCKANKARAVGGQSNALEYGQPSTFKTSHSIDLTLSAI
jgi:hypothetical protein